MSIWSSWLTIEDERQWIAECEADGIKAAVIRDSDPDFDDFDAPIIYQGSHVLPAETDARGGSVDVATPPSHITQNGRGDGEEDKAPWPYIRLSVYADANTYRGAGDATVVLTRRQVERLHSTLAEWLDCIAELGG